METRTMGRRRTQSVETAQVVKPISSAIYRRQPCKTLLRGAIPVYRLLPGMIPHLRIRKYCRERSPNKPQAISADVHFFSLVGCLTVDLDRDCLTVVSTGGVKYLRSGPRTLKTCPPLWLKTSRDYLVEQILSTTSVER